MARPVMPQDDSEAPEPPNAAKVDKATSAPLRVLNCAKKASWLGSKLALRFSWAMSKCK
ncbi:MAG: hypothetical protein L6R35_000310 [Caloplaca aegaea]|nr:MAG: hypothetical protein L6R35_000310 [Caloplaca aegaea]